MAIKATRCNCRRDGPEMTVEEFKKCLMRFDYNKDGRISAAELREAIRTAGRWFSTMKARRDLKFVDANSNGFVDEDEISKLVVFAEKHFGLTIVHD